MRLKDLNVNNIVSIQLNISPILCNLELGVSYENYDEIDHDCEMDKDIKHIGENNRSYAMVIKYLLYKCSISKKIS